ncbi:hypothetical protein MPSEU_001001000 [Mayamaea pseudoterrestris]|nr:hypothetical protein MPSEU_001001000 [Mayamaea pseudoterrestris]
MNQLKQEILVLWPVLLALQIITADAWTTCRHSLSIRSYSPSFRRAVVSCAARRKKRDDDDLFDWYDSVDADATPEDVFWSEMQKMTLSRGATNGDAPTPTWTSAAQGPAPAPEANAESLPLTIPATIGVTAAPALAPGTPMTTSASSSAASRSSSSSMPPPPMALPIQQQPRRQKREQQGQNNLRSVDSILSEYAAFAVADNWLDDDLRVIMDQQANNESDGEALALAQRMEEQGTNSDNLAYMLQSDDPWAQYGMSAEQAKEDRIVIDPSKNKEIWYDPETDDGVDAAREEAETLARLSNIKASSPSLDRARDNPKAKAFFQREPNSLAGCDRMWVSAVDNACFSSLRGSFRNYGVDFCCNFGDFEDGCIEDKLVTIEDMASFKARKVYEATGLPCLATRTSFEIEPIPQFDAGKRPPNARVASGYRFNDVGAHVDYICDAMKLFSEHSRVTQFKTCMCYYDGEMEVYDYGILDCDLIFAHSLRTFVPVAQAQHEMIKTLELTFGLEYMPWLNAKPTDSPASNKPTVGAASLKLRDRVLKEGKVLPNNIVDVSAFMDSMVDVDLMEDCAKELSERCMTLQPTKILTVATTGLVIALPMGKHLSVGVVYARKERNMVMADTYHASYSSRTVGKNRELLVSTKHLDETDRVLIVDDFLSSGSSQEALLRIVAESGATAVGVAVLLEKVYESGRQSLSGYDVPVFSVCRIASVQDGVIQMLEEEGYIQTAVS